MKLTLKIDETIEIGTGVDNPKSCGFCSHQSAGLVILDICHLFLDSLDHDSVSGFNIRSEACHAHEVKRTLPTPPDPYISASKFITEPENGKS